MGDEELEPEMGDEGRRGLDPEWVWIPEVYCGPLYDAPEDVRTLVESTRAANRAIVDLIVGDRRIRQYKLRLYEVTDEDGDFLRSMNIRWD